MKGNRSPWGWAIVATMVCLHGNGIARAADADVPRELEPWRGWVLDGQEYRRCPFFARSGAANAEDYACAWPEKLVLDLTARGGRFSQRWQVYDESWVELPGNREHWPRDVRIGEAAAAVVERGGTPHLLLKPGTHSIAGVFRWESRPELLPVPKRTGVVLLTSDGQRVEQPERTGEGVWLGRRRTAEERQHLDIQVYRLLQDDIPGTLTTLVRLQVSGAGREELLSRVLPEHFVPLQLVSGLPARLESDGRLRVQVRAGSHQVTVVARAPGVIEQVRRPAADGPWPAEEVWSFRSVDRLRAVSVEGASGIDPSQAAVPENWKSLPAYRMTPNDELKLIERSRGLTTADENQLRLRRELWRDFDGDGFTARDHITGTMRQEWRLDAREPQRLMSAVSRGENLLITRGSEEGSNGVELRSPDVDLAAVARIESDGALSASGWQSRFADVQGVVHLPPGSRLLAAVGSDHARASWIERWRLLDMFLVLIVGVAAVKLFGWGIGAVALLALVLVYHEFPATAWLFLNALVAYLLTREAPEGRLRVIAATYRAASFLALLIVLVPFVFFQLRLALHPQLERPAWAPEVSRLGEEAPSPAQMNVPTEEAGVAVAPPAATAPPEAEAGGADRLEKRSADSLLSNRRYLADQVTQRYAPGTVLQVGPGIPAWQYNTYHYGWSGPVEADQTVRFIVLSPALLRIWRVLGCVLVVAFFVYLVHVSFGWPRQLPPWTRRLGFGAACWVLTVTVLSGIPIHTAHAQTPDVRILEELKTRLTRPPECAPACGEIMHAAFRANGDSLDIDLRISALAPVAVAVPGANGRWEPESITVDGVSNAALLGDSNSRLWMPLRPGTHLVELRGRIASVDSLQLQFPMRPHTVEFTGTGWEASGISDGRLLTDSLELLRQRSADSQDRFDAGGPFPAFARVDRQFALDLDWTLRTTVVRVSPGKGALTLRVPLLPGESVLTPGVELRDRTEVLAAIPAGSSIFTWESGLARTESFELSVPQQASRAETWRFHVSPQWHVAFNGSPPILPEELVPEAWVFLFAPRPGEKLTVSVSRPQAAAGGTLAIDSVKLASDVGKRTTDTTLDLTYRSTQGGRHTIVLPADARVTAVTSDGASIPLRPTDGELTFAVLPGSHAVQVKWENGRGVTLHTRAPAVELRAPASNITTQIDLAASRWPLFAYGPGVGPAMLIWGELLIFAALAFLIGRTRYSPLRTHEWLLLGLGLSTFSWGVLILVAGWMFVMRWREQLSDEMSRIRFNTTQILLALLSIVALISLLAAIPNGLLGSPDMRVRASDGRLYLFEWFTDLSAGTLPQPAVISVSIWWYKAAMLAWALWLSFALIRWLPWAWRAWTKHRIWDDGTRNPVPLEARR